MAAVTPPPSVLDAVRRFAGAVRARFGDRVSDLVLFGSHARHEAHEESDVDVLVSVRDLSDAERLEILDLAYHVDASLEEWVGLSPLVYSSAHAARMRAGGRRLFREIDRDGVRL
jgi:predicted nucleotidyltransferase